MKNTPKSPQLAKAIASHIFASCSPHPPFCCFLGHAFCIPSAVAHWQNKFANKLPDAITKRHAKKTTQSYLYIMDIIKQHHGRRTAQAKGCN
jgi:hypothetical protein